MTNYTITVSGAELDVIRLAIGRMCEPKEVKPRAAKLAMMPIIDTGNPELDDWLRAKYRAGVVAYVAKALPSDAPLKQRKWTPAEVSSNQRFHEYAVAAWRRLGHEVTITGRTIDRDGSNVHVKPLGASTPN